MYTKSAREMYIAMRSPWVSPNGLASAIQMQEFFVNRAGSRLPTERRKAIKLSSEYLRIELKHLKLQLALKRGKLGYHRTDKRVKDMLNNELAYQLMRREFDLDMLPRPVHPPPQAEKRIGGRNGYNGPYKPI